MWDLPQSTIKDRGKNNFPVFIANHPTECDGYFGVAEVIFSAILRYRGVRPKATIKSKIESQEYKETLWLMHSPSQPVGVLHCARRNSPFRPEPVQDQRSMPVQCVRKFWGGGKFAGFGSGG
jgi:hypothetical protein